MKDDFTMVLGPDSSANLLEVGFINSKDQDVIVHAMSARPKFLR